MVPVELAAAAIAAAAAAAAAALAASAAEPGNALALRSSEQRSMASLWRLLWDKVAAGEEPGKAWPPRSQEEERQPAQVVFAGPKMKVRVSVLAWDVSGSGELWDAWKPQIR